MTAVAARYSRPSPRSEEFPTAFTAGEFIRGAVIAWIGFNLLAPFMVLIYGTCASLLLGDVSGLSWAPAVIMYTPVFAVPWSLGALLLLGIPMAFMVGTAMRRRSYSGAHLWAFAWLGAAVGSIAMVCWFLWSSLPKPGVTINYMVVQSPWTQVNWVMVALMAATTALAVCNGWRFTMRRALRSDEAFCRLCD